MPRALIQDRVLSGRSIALQVDCELTGKDLIERALSKLKIPVNLGAKLMHDGKLVKEDTPLGTQLTCDSA